jgi:type IV pilus assembly protein PilB
VLTEQQLTYAMRVRSKLISSKTIKDTLLDLGYVSHEQIREVLHKNKVNVRLGDLLVELGYLRESDLQQALGMHKDSGEKKRLGEILVEGGFIEERRLLETLSYQLGYPLIELDFVKIDRTLLNTIPLNICRENSFIPVRREGNMVLVAFSDPLDHRARNIAERYLSCDFNTAIASAESVRDALHALERSAVPLSVSDENTIIGMINTLFDGSAQRFPQGDRSPAFHPHQGHGSTRHC